MHVRELINLPTPDFSFDPSVPGACVTGVRPYRKGTFRLNYEQTSGRFIVHNYGHGGAGISLSWGCAAKVKDMVRQFLTTSPQTEAAVLGAGVMGLTAATMLLDLGLKIRIFSDRKLTDTTSFKAGGQWAVSVVETAMNQQDLKAIIKTSYTTFKDSIGKGFGVCERPNYCPKPADGLEMVLNLLPGLLPARRRLDRLPFQNHTQLGFLYQTLLIEPPIFLPRLKSDLEARGVTFVDKKFASKADIFATVPQKIIINCTGMGAKKLWNDTEMVGVRGYLAMLPAQPALQYLYSRNGYLFPRSDHVVIGGTTDRGKEDEDLNPAKCKELVDVIAAAFGQLAPVPMPIDHIDHPRNRRLVDPRLSVSD
ncbi:FAD-binding oxidoreductase [Nonomuraea gerenzanensis]|uniref:D-amino-acid oxidase n=1 Tax=Nonomuraea gerenzanensis TaxID=93944 RepID=A0A1M4EIX9_9ACTN|nr:FAD-binding oxidoreductase [Nonomuraea gerenzanensis]UBU10370.1 FAD-dependent oxidoreductase [Nonomuraea gerenzanensis]SBO98766.1 D-amino-acid oxidase [Nonomuraea gerenzanensis]